jgi:hypothetical protein
MSQTGLLPNVVFRTGCWRDITRVERPMSQIDPLPPPVGGRFEATKIANFPKTSIGADARWQIQFFAKRTFRPNNSPAGHLWEYLSLTCSGCLLNWSNRLHANLAFDRFDG